MTSDADGRRELRETLRRVEAGLPAKAAQLLDNLRFASVVVTIGPDPDDLTAMRSGYAFPPGARIVCPYALALALREIADQLVAEHDQLEAHMRGQQ